MKIDFQQSFGTVSRLISTRAKAAYDNAAVEPQKAEQLSEFKAQFGQDVGPLRAPILPPVPGINAPGLEPIATPTRSVNFDRESVKPPTILSVERLDPEVNNEELSLKSVLDSGSGMASLARDIKYEPAKLSRMIASAGIDHGIDPALGVAVATAESSLNPTAVSADGHASKGLFQLLDRTGAQLHRELGNQEESYDPFEPQQNIKLGMRYLRKLHEFFSEPTEIVGIGTTVPAANSASLEKLAVAAFNAGEGRVTSAQSRAAKLGFDPSNYDQVSRFLPDSTQSYVQKVLSLKGRFDDTSRIEDEFT